jgi:PTS system mannose-specific IIC component
MNLFQALMCGIIYYLGSSTWVVGIGFYTFARPVINGFFVGLILGDPVTGAIVGATIQMIYLGFMATGGSFPTDAALAGVMGTAVAIQTGLSPEQAVAIAVPIGMLGTIFYQVRMMIIGIFWAHTSDRVAEQGLTNRIWYTAVLGPEICMALLYVVPSTLALYLGVDAIKGLIDLLAGGRILAILGVIGGMLPALGIAMNMKAIFKGDARLFFFVGFLMVVYLNLNLIAIGCFALLIAILYVKFDLSGKDLTA